MLLKMGDSLKEYYLKPGFIYISLEPVKIISVLGSCVAVCIFDNRLRYGGVNHYILAIKPPEETASSRFGDVSVHYMLRCFRENGSRISDLSARLVGGAFMKDNQGSEDIAFANAKIAEKILHQYKIRIISRNIGGTRGRKLVYFSATNEVNVVFVDSKKNQEIMWVKYGSD